MQSRLQAQGLSSPNMSVLAPPLLRSLAGPERRLRRGTRSPKSPAKSLKPPKPQKFQKSPKAPKSLKSPKPSESPQTPQTPQTPKTRTSPRSMARGSRKGVKPRTKVGKDGDILDARKTKNGNEKKHKTDHNNFVSATADREFVVKEVPSTLQTELAAGTKEANMKSEDNEKTGDDPTRAAESSEKEEVLVDPSVRRSIREAIPDKSTTRRGTATDTNVTEEVLDEGRPTERPSDGNVTEEVLDKGKSRRRSADRKATEEIVPKSKPKTTASTANVTEEVLAESGPKDIESEDNVTEEVLAGGEPKRRHGSRREKVATSPDKTMQRARSPWKFSLGNNSGKVPSSLLDREHSRPEQKKKLPSIGLHAMKFAADLNAVSDVELDSPEMSRQQKQRDQMDDDESSSESDASGSYSPRHSTDVRHSRPYPGRRNAGHESDESDSDTDSGEDNSDEGSDSQYSELSIELEPSPPKATPRKRPSRKGTVRKSQGKRPRASKQKHVQPRKSDDAFILEMSSNPVMKRTSPTAVSLMGREDATIEEALTCLDGMIKARRRRGRPSKSALKERERLEKLKSKLYSEIRAIERTQGSRRQTRRAEDDAEDLGKIDEAVRKVELSSSGSSCDSEGDSESPESSPSEASSDQDDADVVPGEHVAGQAMTKVPSRDRDEKEARAPVDNEQADAVMAEASKVDDDSEKQAPVREGAPSFSRFKNRKSPSPKQAAGLEAEQGVADTVTKIASCNDGSGERDFDSDKGAEEHGRTGFKGNGEAGQQNGHAQAGTQKTSMGRRRAVKGPRKEVIQRMLVSKGARSATTGGAGKTLPPEYMRSATGVGRKRRERSSSFANLDKAEPDKKRRSKKKKGKRTAGDAPGEADRAETTGGVARKLKALGLDGAPARKVASGDAGGAEVRVGGAGGRGAARAQGAVPVRGGAGGVNAEEFERLRARVGELEGLLGERERELEERGDRMREKSAALAGLLAEVKRLEREVERVRGVVRARDRAAEEELRGNLRCIAELERELRERDGGVGEGGEGEMERLREEVRMQAGVIKNAVRANRNLQQKVYAARGGR